MKKSDAVELVDMICGDVIGRGAYRTVFEYRLDPTMVIKHDTGEAHSNLWEFYIWKEVQFTEMSKWFAPVKWMSPGGTWLVQARTVPLREGEFPERIPKMFVDTKASNWGLLNGVPVCHDFGHTRVIDLGLKQGKQLTTAHWRQE